MASRGWYAEKEMKLRKYQIEERRTRDAVDIIVSNYGYNLYENPKVDSCNKNSCNKSNTKKTVSYSIAMNWWLKEHRGKAMPSNVKDLYVQACM